MGYGNLTNRGSINVNVNETQSIELTMTMNNDIVKAKKVEAIARSLVQKFTSEDSFPFYCKVAYKLPEHMIWNIYEQALKGKTPAGLFNWICRKEMDKS